MKTRAGIVLVSLMALGGCAANLRRADFGPIEYLVLTSRNADNVPASALREAAIRQATAGCRQNHQGFKLIDGNAGPPPNISFTESELRVQELKDVDARDYTSASIVFRCVGDAAKT